MGLAPGHPEGTYIQRVPKVGITSHPEAFFPAGAERVTFTPEYTAQSRRLEDTVAVRDSDVVFGGYGEAG